ncbi:MAG: hypothetical protein IJB01_03010 [Bacteroidaceae bacterium]|nr:hypothetical protein [Bacteroidaceae bacterium]
MIDSKFISLFVISLLFVACDKKEAQEERTVLAEAGGSYLYKDEMDYLVISKNRLKDSASFTDEYIKLWAMDELFYKKAAENVPSSDEIERMVANYRKSLILNIYQDALVDQQLKPSMSDSVIISFYEKNPTLFKADETLVKGVVLKLAPNSPAVAKVRRWCSSITPENVENLEVYCEENHAEFDYFADDWREAAHVARGLPITGKQLSARLSQDKTIEFKENGWTYFVTADSLIRKGDVLPISLVEDEIIGLLVNSRRAEFIKQKKQELYDEAVAEGRIKIHN